VVKKQGPPSLTLSALIFMRSVLRNTIYLIIVAVAVIVKSIMYIPYRIYNAIEIEWRIK
jgi:hydrogenase-4 membrane subunit HyfE